MSKSLQEAARDVCAKVDTGDIMFAPGSKCENNALEHLRTALAAEQGQPTREELIAALRHADDLMRHGLPPGDDDMRMFGALLSRCEGGKS